jgi:hypothetical protein
MAHSLAAALALLAAFCICKASGQATTATLSCGAPATWRAGERCSLLSSNVLLRWIVSGDAITFNATYVVPAGASCVLHRGRERVWVCVRGANAAAAPPAVCARASALASSSSSALRPRTNHNKKTNTRPQQKTTPKQKAPTLSASASARRAA